MINEYDENFTKVNGVLSIKDKPVEVKPGFYAIPGYSQYLISKEGVVFEIAKNKTKPIKMNGNDYPTVHVFSDVTGRSRPVDLHRLLALAFMPIPDTGKIMEVDHKDGNRNNYSLDNLEWVTKTENYMRGRRNHRPSKRVFRMYDLYDKTDRMESDIDTVANILRVDADEIRNLAEQRGGFMCDGTMVQVIDTGIGDSYNNPIYVMDYLDGSGFILRSFSDAEGLLNVSRSSIYHSIVRSNDEDAPYYKGFRFFQVGEEPDDVERLEGGEWWYHRYLRFYEPFIAVGSRGFMVHDRGRNCCFPHYNMEVAETIAKKYCKDGYDIYPIYEKRGSSVKANIFNLFEKSFTGDYFASPGKYIVSLVEDPSELDVDIPEANEFYIIGDHREHVQRGR